MKNIYLLKHYKVQTISLLFIWSFQQVSAQDLPIFTVTDLFDQSKSADDLGLSMTDNTQTVTVFAPAETGDQFSNGVVMTYFKGYFYIQWQSSATDEDAPETWVAYSRSEDGTTWTEPMVLAATIDDGYSSSGGWWVAGDTIIGYINTWPASISPRGGYTRYVASTDGMTWSEPAAVLMDNGDTLTGIFEQDPHALPDGRIINAAHFQPGIVINPIYTDDPKGISGWVKADFENITAGDVSRSIEPSWFYNADGDAVMTFRDQTGSNKRLASISSDRGESWTRPELTDMPDSRSKQSAGNFQDGTAYMVGNPVNNTTRIPLVVTLSEDGKIFNTAYVLRTGSEIQPLRFEGKAKRLGYHYPKSFVHDGFIYVSYATNKEDVEFTKVPLTDLVLNEIVNTAPQVSDQFFRIDENSPEGFEVGVIKAQDTEFDPITFNVLSGNEAGAYLVDVNTGVVTIADSSQVDFEINEQIVLTVEVTDGQLSATADVTITLNDVDEIVLSTIESSKFNVFPNPVADQLIIEGLDVKGYQLYDFSGQLLVSKSETIVNMKALKSGLYMLHVLDKNGIVKTFKIIKK